jgi:hypothetical protein
VRRRFWIEVSASVIAFVLGLITWLWPDWIELLFHVDPDQGSGALEWAIVGGFFIGGLLAGVVARREQLRNHGAQPSAVGRTS